MRAQGNALGLGPPNEPTSPERAAEPHHATHEAGLGRCVVDGVGFTTLGSRSPLGRPFRAGSLRPDGDLGRCPRLTQDAPLGRVGSDPMERVIAVVVKRAAGRVRWRGSHGMRHRHRRVRARGLQAAQLPFLG